MKLPYEIIDLHFHVEINEKERTASYIFNDSISELSLQRLLDMECIEIHSIADKPSIRTKNPVLVAQKLVQWGEWELPC